MSAVTSISIFESVHDGRVAFADAVRGLDHAAAGSMTRELFDELDHLMSDADDHAVLLVPRDPTADDPEAEGWTIGHVICHLTAGLEEGAAQGTSLARGVPTEGRSRFEVEWETIQTADDVRARLSESRRMTLAMLAAWPDAPHLDQVMTPVPHFGPLNAVSRHLLGVMHGASHLNQLRESLRQSRQ